MRTFCVWFETPTYFCERKVEALNAYIAILTAWMVIHAEESNRHVCYDAMEVHCKEVV